MRAEFVNACIDNIDNTFGRKLGCRISPVLSQHVSMDNHILRREQIKKKNQEKEKRKEERNKKAVEGSVTL